MQIIAAWAVAVMNVLCNFMHIMQNPATVLPGAGANLFDFFGVRMNCGVSASASRRWASEFEGC
jgi:hypothetical protein